MNGKPRYDESGVPIPGLQVDCIDVVELVTDYLEGALDVATTAEVEAHLALCGPCQTYLEQMRATIDALGHLPVETLSDEAKATLVDAFRDLRTT
jgi:anti-sigma factor RsiW